MMCTSSYSAGVRRLLLAKLRVVPGFVAAFPSSVATYPNSVALALPSCSHKRSYNRPTHIAFIHGPYTSRASPNKPTPSFNRLEPFFQQTYALKEAPCTGMCARFGRGDSATRARGEGRSQPGPAEAVMRLEAIHSAGDVDPFSGLYCQKLGHAIANRL